MNKKKVIGLFLCSLLLSLGGEAVGATWQQTSGPAGGNIEAVALLPGDVNTVYAGGRGGTVFRSTNGGQNWSPLTSIGSSAIIRQIGVLANGLMYISAGSLYKSTDGGQSAAAVADVGAVNQFAIHPNNEQIVAVASPDGNIYFTDNGFTSVSVKAGIWAGAAVKTVAFGGDNALWAGTKTGGDGRLYKSMDNGNSWTEIEIALPPRTAGTDVKSIHVDPVSASTVYVGLVDANNEAFDAANDGYLLKTTNGGSSWSALHVPHMDSNMNILGQEGGVLIVGSGAYMFKSADGGENWTDITPPARQADGAAYLARSGQTIYAPTPFGTGVLKSTDLGQTWSILTRGIMNVSISLLAAPADQGSGTLYATSPNGEGTFRTTDNGNSWENLVFNGITHRWADELQVSPHNNAEVWQVADVGEIFRTTDRGDSWQKIINPYGAGFRYGSIYAMASAPYNRARVYSLRSGFGIYRSTNSGDSWSFLHHSEIDYSYSLAVHPANENIVYSGFLPKPFQGFAMIRKSGDGGENWETALQITGSTGITSVAIDPTAPSTVYAGSSGNGGAIWKSDDSGGAWQQPNEYFTLTNVHTLTADPSHPDVAYAGIWGGGTWKTDDRGRSWTRLPNDPTVSASAILVHPGDSNIIYIADRTAPRIYKTTNGGAAWAIWFDAGEAYYRIMSAELSLANPDVVLASVFLRGGPMLGDLFRIDHGAAGKITANLPRLPVSVAAHPNNGNVLYAVTHMQGLYKTVNGGQSWSDLTAGGTVLPLNVGFIDLVIDSTRPDTLYLIGGSDVDESLSHRGADPAAMNTVYKSTDGGASWVNCNDGSFGANSGAVKGLAISPLDADVLFAATENGVFRSKNGGSSWSRVDAGLNYTHMAGVAISAGGAALYCPTLGGGVYAGVVAPVDHSVVWDAKSALAAEIYHVLVRVHPSDSSIVYASAYPGGVFKSMDGGKTWRECNFGMASFRIDDPRRQGYYAFAIAENNPRTLYLGLYGVGVYKSTDGAETWMPMNGLDQTMRGLPVTDMLINPIDANDVIVATENGIYRTTSGGSSWSPLNAGMDTLDVRTLAWAGNGRIYAGTRGYEVYLFEENNQWRQLPGFGQYGTFWPIWNNRPLYQYTSLLFHPTNPDTIYIGTFPAGIFKSVDGGRSWREKNVGWLNDGVFSLAFKPGDPNIIYAGTYNGLSVSFDGGEHWRKWSDGWPGEQWVFSLDFDPRNPAVIYACSKNGEDEGQGREGFHGTVMKSIDGGNTWAAITTGLQLNNEFYKIVVDKHFPDTLYLATQHEGVFISRDAGANWAPFNEGLTNLAPGTNGNNVTNTMLLSDDGNYLYFGSNGSGVFKRLLHDDTDGDGLADAWEREYWANLTMSDGASDADGDGLTDRQEYVHLSSPVLADTDKDGMPDAWEVRYRLNPLVADGSFDLDGDGYTNLQEFLANTSPADAASKPRPADAVTLAATGISITSATLNGTVNPHGFSTRYHFEYGLTDAYGNSTSVTDAGSGMADIPVSTAITNFLPNTVYHYRIVADTGFDVSYGDDATFTYVVAPGDVDLSGAVNLMDAHIVMGIISGSSVSEPVHTAADVNGDGKLGIAEIIYSLQKGAGLRE